MLTSDQHLANCAKWDYYQHKGGAELRSDRACTCGKDLIAQLREELEKRSFHSGDGQFQNIEYCDFCGYSRLWVSEHEHGAGCLLRKTP